MWCTVRFSIHARVLVCFGVAGCWTPPLRRRPSVCPVRSGAPGTKGSPADPQLVPSPAPESCAGAGERNQRAAGGWRPWRLDIMMRYIFIFSLFCLFERLSGIAALPAIAMSKNKNTARMRFWERFLGQRPTTIRAFH